MEETFCSCGCSKPINPIGTRNRPKHYLPGHHKPVDITKRFWAKVNKDGPIPEAQSELGSCWIWKASTLNGYGQFRLPRQTGGMIKAPILSWILTYGPIPEGKFTCHKCDNPSCCNPKHLFLGTRIDNSKDMVTKGRSLVGQKNPKAKLTSEQVKQIKQQHTHIYGMRKRLAAKYGVSTSTISRIVTSQGYRGWKHI